jgi:HEPN domain-containing protein
LAKVDGYTPSELLDKARKAREAGDEASACRLAQESNDAAVSADAMEILGVCACKSGDAIKVARLLKRLPRARHAPITEACAAAGVTL